ncbi:sulfite exporter TauE/SafE family protein [Roseobacter sp.]|uniref:sulfite exporter TauE/SafE family protein n=1 Tax=Roseobacter sp. TaxID=1907202 RepID=UPI00329974B8
MDYLTLFYVAGAAFLFAGAVKGLAGIGMPTAAIALMTLVLDPRTAIALVLFPMLGSNAWQVLRAGQLWRTVRRYRVFAVVLFVGVASTVFATQDTGDRALLAILGAVILFFVVMSWRGLVPPLAAKYDRHAQIGFGVLAGVVGGMTAGWGAPIAMYLATKQVDKDEFVRATGFLIFVGSLPLCVTYIQLGFMTGPLAGVSIAMLIPTLIGFTLGEKVRNRLSGTGFRTAILVVFAVMGINLIRRAIWYV